MNISLKRPLAIFDLEATGLDITNDRIVEIAIIKMNPDGSEEHFEKRVNPEMPIPQEAIDIHGITNEEITSAPTLKDILPELEAFIEDCDFAGFNSNKFDLPMLAEELLRVESTLNLAERKHIDVQNIFHKMEQRTLVAAYKFYCQKNLENAHSALADARATWEVLDAQISKYEELSEDVDFLANFSRFGDASRADFAGRLVYNKDGVVCYNFGKHKGKTVEQVYQQEAGYYGWMIDADFPRYTKQVLRTEMLKIKAKKHENPSSMENKLNALKNKFNQG